ncbi:MAG TPA: DUF4192 domain-containing protein [Streptosporangiaceae bacterium]|jgi:hypothetical protein
MTATDPAGDAAPRTRIQPASPSVATSAAPGGTPRVRVDTLPGLLAVVPYLLGFHPASSLVIIGVDPPRGRVRVTFRFDLPDPPDPAAADRLAAHAAGVLSQQRISTVIAVGYGPGTLVTPVMERLRPAIAAAGVTPRDLVRVADDRYWSYLCADPRCCPPQGTAFDPVAHPAAAELTAAGVPAYRDREALSRTLAPLAGPAAAAMREATARAEARARQQAGGGQPGTAAAARHWPARRRSVQRAIAAYRGGGQVTDPGEFAWLGVVLAELPVRDDAWARMEFAYRDAHRRLWTDLVRRVAQPYLPAPASLLAFTAWQSGDGVIASIALDLALAADPGYSMALLLSEAIESGLPPSAARLPMTPAEVEESYRPAAGPGPG